MRPAEQDGYGLDAMWNDDFHHTAVVALTGRNEAYYSDYRGTAQELASAVRWGFLYQGQRYAWQKQRAGDAGAGSVRRALRDLSGEPRSGREHGARRAAGGERRSRPAAGDDGAAAARRRARRCCSRGRSGGRPDRFSTSPTTTRSWPPRSRRAGSTSCRSSRRSRRRRSAPRCPRPARPRPSRRASSTGPSASGTRPPSRCTAICSALRREDPAFAAGRRELVHAGGAGRPGAGAAVLRAGGRADAGRSAADRQPRARPRPRLGGRAAARAAGRTALAHGWSSEEPRYGGSGTAPVETDEGLRLPGHAAIVLAPQA